MSGMLPDRPAVTLNAEGVRRAVTGREIGPADIEMAGGPAHQSSTGFTLVRLVDTAGQLVGVGEPSGTPGLLHPSVVLK
jgi:hypothetical protein